MFVMFTVFPLRILKCDSADQNESHVGNLIIRELSVI